MLIAESDDDVGAAQQLLDARRSRGETVHVELGTARGDPATVHLSAQVDRDLVESEFDLGPLLAWLPAPGYGLPDGWVLRDSMTGTSIYGGGPDARPAAGPATPPAQRARIGWVDQHPQLRNRAWDRPAPEVELSRVPLSQEHPEASWRFVECDDVRATLGRVEEVLAVVLPPLAEGLAPELVVDRLPEWFVQRCARPYRPGDPPTPAASPIEATYALAPVGMVDMSAGRLRAWSIRWTPLSWVVAMQSSQRLWAWRASLEVSATVVQVGWTSAGGEVPMGAARWLLHACGATGCVAPFKVDHFGYRRDDPPPVVPPAQPQPEPWTWNRVKRLFTTPEA